MTKRLVCYQGKWMGIGARTILLNSCLFTTVLFMSSFCRELVGVRKRIFFFALARVRVDLEISPDKLRNCLFPKGFGSVGVINLDIVNITLLCKWLWKFENEDGPWQHILKKKYLQKEILSQATGKLGISMFWSGLMKVKHIFYTFCSKLCIHNAARAMRCSRGWV
jgi:hypothetical protein